MAAISGSDKKPVEAEKQTEEQENDGYWGEIGGFKISTTHIISAAMLVTVGAYFLYRFVFDAGRNISLGGDLPQRSIDPLQFGAKFSPYDTGKFPLPPGVFPPGGQIRIAGYSGPLPQIPAQGLNQGIQLAINRAPQPKATLVSNISIDRDGDNRPNQDSGPSYHERERDWSDTGSSAVRCARDLAEARGLAASGHPILAADKCISAARNGSEVVMDVGSKAVDGLKNIEPPFSSPESQASISSQWETRFDG